MRLYTIQPLFVVDCLRQGQTFSPRPQDDSANWLNDGSHTAPRAAYDWLCEQMVQRGLARPHPQAYPVWAWHQWAGPRRRKPDLRSSSVRSSDAQARQVLLTLDVPEVDVLLHDYDAWHFALNYWFLAKERAGDRFERRCQARGLNFYRQKPLPDPQLHAEMLATWERMFDLRKVREVLGIKASAQQVQATFWQIEPLHVQSATAFGAGRPAERLSIARGAADV